MERLPVAVSPGRGEHGFPGVMPRTAAAAATGAPGAARQGVPWLRSPSVIIFAVLLVLTLLLLSSGKAHAAEPLYQAEPATGLSPVTFALIFFGICTVIGIIAVLGGVGGGVVFTPLMMGFTPFDSYIIRATGLFIAMCGSLVAARPFLRRGLANVRLLLFAGMPYSVFAVTGALAAGYIKANLGESGDAVIRLALGLLVIILGLMIILGGRRVEYPEVDKVDGFTRRLALSMSYFEKSLNRVVDYRVKRAPVGILLFCGVGLLSGLFGLGAGWAIVPVFNLVMLAPLKVAAASSSVLISMGDTGAIWPYLMRGGIFPLFAVPCMIGMVLGATMGARLMPRIKASFTRWLVIALMFGSGVKLVLDGLSSFGII
jgi:uncharacterized membrane protein YfcA